ncbi:MAG: aminoglycoside phosphotransferase family protein [Clostridia bacterium]|nr:aminoglycoside phosphotransferase family protein [Clostridia bacterium]
MNENRPTFGKLVEILVLFDLSVDSKEYIRAFTADEDGTEYAVWHIKSAEGEFVLKRAKAFELEVYRRFLTPKKAYAPEFFGSVNYEGSDYLLLEYCPGETLNRCERGRLIKALDAIIAMQDEFWLCEELYDSAVTLEYSLEGIGRRGQYLDSELLERAYAEFVRVYKSTPRTLCHDDLLPFNLLVGERAVLFDWEYGGMLPYPSSLARLIAHSTEDGDAFFYMKDADRAFAIDYYYDNLLKKRGVGYDEYRRTLDLFLFYEYCEWIMLGNRFDNRDDERYIRSKKLADELAEKLLSDTPLRHSSL